MATNIGGMLRSLGRGRMSAALGQVVEETPEGTSILTMPNEVEQWVSDHFARHFTHPDGDRVEVAGEWGEEYREADELPSTLAAPITTDELNEWIARAPKRKAPGPSGVPAELIQATGSRFRERLRTVYNVALEEARIPDHWAHGRLIPIPKAADMDRVLAKHRPIMLLETSRKILTRILTARMQDALDARLEDTNLGFRPDKRATDLAMMLQRWADLRRGDREQMELLSLDIAKAYYSVWPQLLELSLRRLGVPAALRVLIGRLHEGRQIEVAMVHACPVPFVQSCGLAQGDALSPLLWIAVYDPLLAFPELAACREPRQGRERCWWAYVTDILAQRGVSIAAPTMAGDLHPSILAALRPGWTAGGAPVPPAKTRGGWAAWNRRFFRVGEATLDSDDGRAYAQMAWSGILRIDQVFCLAGGVLQLCPGPGRAFWAGKMRTQLAVLSGEHQGSPRPCGLHEAAIRRALDEEGRWRRGQVPPFQAAQLRRTFAWMRLGERAAGAAKVVVYTDGSLTPAKREQAATMGFAAVFRFEASTGPADEVVISGATQDGPFSSTTAELMAILVVAVLMPPDQETVVRSDSQAAIAIVWQLQDKSCYRWQSSPLAYLASWYVDSLRARTAPLQLEWIRGHSGEAGNEKADRAAKAAQRPSAGWWWTLRLGRPPRQPFWLCYNGEVAPKTTGQFIRLQEESWMVGRLRLQMSDAEAQAREPPPPPAVTEGAPAAAVATERPLLGTRAVRETLEALNWAVVEDGRALARKNSWRLTSLRDSNIRGFVLGGMLGLLPVMVRQHAWYPQAYPEAEMRLCPRGCGEPETQCRLFTCREVTRREPAPQERPADRWAERAICAPGAHMAIPEEWLDASLDALAAELRPAVCTPQALQVLRDLTREETVQQKMTERGRTLRKVAARMRWLYEYDALWKTRNSLQLDREQASGQGVATRRRLMREAPRPQSERNGGTPQRTRTVDEGALARHCRAWVGRWSRGTVRAGSSMGGST